MAAAANPGIGITLLEEGVWASLGVVWKRLQKRAFPLREPPSRSGQYTPIAEPDSADLEALQRMAELLREAGDQYAQLLRAQLQAQ